MGETTSQYILVSDISQNLYAHLYLFQDILMLPCTFVLETKI